MKNFCQKTHFVSDFKKHILKFSKLRDYSYHSILLLFLVLLCTISSKKVTAQCTPSTYYPYYMGISHVILNSINNNSGTTNYTYQNFTNLTTDVQVGTSTNLYVGGWGYEQYATVWIDFNSNFSFEESERIATGIHMNHACNINITIPNGTTLGSHRMRIRSQYLYDGVQYDQCAATNYGEAEDYTINVTAPCTPPATAGFGDNTWNVLGYEHGGYNYGNLGSLSGQTFKGYYTDATVDINSQARWNSDGTPSSASGWSGCSVTADNHTVVYKRQGFPTNNYQIDLNTHDDGVQCYVNGTLVYETDGCCADRGIIWSGILCSTSTVEFRVMEGGGGSNLAVDFIESAFTAGTLSGTQNICPGSTSALSTSGLSGGTWSSSNLGVATVNTSTGLATAVGSGSSTITYVVSGGSCPNTSSTIDVTVLPSSSAGVLSGTQAACVGATTTFSSNGTSGGTWSSSNTSVATVDASSGVIIGVSAGTATITYTVLGTGGCPNTTATRDVTFSVAPSVNAGSDAIICNGLSAQLNGSGGISGNLTMNINGTAMDETSWSLTNSSGNVIASGSGVYSSGQNYNYSPSSSNGPYTFIIETQGSYNDNGANYSISCNGSALFSGYIGGGQYISQSIAACQTTADLVWSPSTNLSSNTVSNPTCSATTTTTYTLTATTNGCSVTDQVLVTVLSSSSAGVLSGTQAACVGATTTFSSNGTSGGTWTSSNTSVATVDASSGVITGVSAGTATITYTVLGTDGCPNTTATRDVTFSVAPNSGVLSGTQNTCIGNTTTFSSNGTAGGAWSSSNTSIATIDASSGVITGVSGGTATITYSVLGTGGCADAIATLPITVGESATAPSSIATSSTSICNGESVDLSYTGGSGNAFGWYTSSCGGTLEGNGNNLTVIPSINPIVATGGTVSTYIGNGTNGTAGVTYKEHTFTSGNSTFNVTNIGNGGQIDYIIVAGGGAGGSGYDRTTGGGGGGGVIQGTFNLSAQNYQIVVGSGGINSNGQNSSAFGQTAIGGGLGSSSNYSAGSGGSGGGGRHNSAPNIGTPGQGNNGGNGYDSGNTDYMFGAGGGGGAASAGGSASWNNAGNGGAGVASSINGTPSYYGGGGGGGAQFGYYAQSYPSGTGGSGGGGNGGRAYIYGGTQASENGQANTGGGGGGGGGQDYVSGGNGGSGIVIIRYAIPTSATYYGRWEDNCGGSACSSITIELNPIEAPTSVSASSNAICAGQSTLLSYTGGSGTTFKWYTSSCGGTLVGTGNSFSISPSATTTYYGRWENATCNSSCLNLTVSVSNPVDAGNISGNNSICVGATTAFASSGTNGGTWSSSNTSIATVDASSGVITGVSAGTVTITYSVIGSGDCPDASATRDVTIFTAPNAGALSGTQTVCSGNTTTYSSNGTAGGAWSSSNTSIATIDASSGVITGVSGGTSTITYSVLGSGGCPDASATRDVTIFAAPNAGALSGIQTGCAGTTTTFSSNGTAGGVWTSSNLGIATVDASSGVITGVAAGTATITYTVSGSGGCADASATRDVTFSTSPTANAGSDVVTCAGQGTTLSGNGSSNDTYTYTISMSDSYGDGWNGGYLSAFINGAWVGNYAASGSGSTATINLAAGQTIYFNYSSSYYENENSYTISLNNTAVHSAGAYPPTGTVYTNNNHPTTYTYSWSPATSLSSATIISPTCTASATTTYTLTVTKNGCSATDQVVVSMRTIPGAPTVSGNPTTICPGSTTQLEVAGLAPSGQAFQGNGSNSYIKVYQDIPEYNFTTELWIKTAELNTGIFGVYEDGGGHDRHLYLNNGQLWVRVYSGNGWNTNATVNDNQWHHIALTVQSGVGQKVYVDGNLVATYGYDHSDFTWQTCFHIGYSNDMGHFNGLLDNVRIWNTVRTQTELSANMYLNAPNGSGLVCNYLMEGNANATTVGNNGNAYNNAWVDANFLTYTWSGTAAPTPSYSQIQTTAAIYNSVNYTVAASGGGCLGDASAPVAITVNALPTADAGTSTAGICQGATSVALGGSFGGSATGAIWSGGTGTFANNSGSSPNTATYTASATENGLITLTLTTSGGPCGTTTATKTITVNANPTVTANASAAQVCSGSAVTLSGGGASSYLWDNGATNGVAITPTSTTLYTVTGTDVNNCTNTASIQISTISPITITSQPVSLSPVCINTVHPTLSMGASGQGNLSYQWFVENNAVNSNPAGIAITGANGTSYTPSATNAGNYSYYCQVTSDLGVCPSTTTNQVEAFVIPYSVNTITVGDYIWVGLQNQTWEQANNWYEVVNNSYVVASILPTASDNVIIPDNSACIQNQPIISSGALVANDVTIEPGATVIITGTATLQVNGDLQIDASGVLAFQSATTLSVDGNWENNGVFTANQGTVNFIGNGTHTIDNNGQNFHNISISNAGTVQLLENLSVLGNFTNSGGTLNMNNFDMTIAGNYLNYGLIPGTGTLFFSKGSGVQTAEQSGNSFGNLEHTGAGSLQLLTNITSVGNIANTNGIFDGNSKQITLSGNWNNTATFTAGVTGLVVFEKTGGTQTVDNGTSNFAHFTHSGSSLLGLSGTIDIKGDMQIDAPINAGSSTVKISGTGDQLVTGTNAFLALNNFKVEKTSGKVTLNSPIGVSGVLSMVSGNIFTSNADLLTIGTSSLTPGSIVYTSGSVVGPIKRHVMDGVGEYRFPVGNTINGNVLNRWAEVAFESAPGTNQLLTVEYKTGSPISNGTTLYNGLPLNAAGELIENYTSEGYWEVLPTNSDYSQSVNSVPYTFKVFANNINGVQDYTKTRLIKSPGSNVSADSHIEWIACGQHGGFMNAVSNSNFEIWSQHISGYSYFTVGGSNGSNPLPVELISFQANCRGAEQVEINWSTASEHNASHYIIEKSRDAVNWTTWNTIGAAGNSTSLLEYTLIDWEVAGGTNYYKLTQFDFDGVSETFNISSSNCDDEATKTSLTTYPNPSNGDFYIDFYTQEMVGESFVTVVDSRGVIVYSQEIEIKKGSNIFNLENTHADPGMYYIKVSNKTTDNSYIVKHSLR